MLALVGNMDQFRRNSGQFRSVRWIMTQLTVAEQRLEKNINISCLSVMFSDAVGVLHQDQWIRHRSTAQSVDAF